MGKIITKLISIFLLSLKKILKHFFVWSIQIRKKAEILFKNKWSF